MMSDNKTKYNYLENVLQSINRKYVSLNKDEEDRNKKILEECLGYLISKMQEKNPLFKILYRRVFYGGSYYDGLRVGSAVEFDLDLLFSLPKYSVPTLINSNKPGFVHIQLQEFLKWQKQPEAHRYTGLEKFLDSKHYLETGKVSSWIESIITQTLNDFPKCGNDIVFNSSSGCIFITVHKGGPAFTLKLKCMTGSEVTVIDIDLVPCFEFTKEKWPPSPYRPNSVSDKPNFFIVPKKPRGATENNVERYWRLSFQEQERVMIHDSRTLKPSLKVLKKLRDNLDHKPIASYYIKTVYLWENEKDKDLWNNSLSYVFMTMLKKYQQYIESGKIPYFWNKNNNLLQTINASNLKDISNRLSNIINDIEKHPSDPYIVAKYLLNSDELDELK